MKVDLFDFDLPPERIAQEPVTPRDASRMLVVGTSSLADQHASDFPEFLKPNDVVVFNNTKVIPARLTGWRGDAKVEVTLHKMLKPNCWQAFAKPAKRLKPGDWFEVADGFRAQVAAKHESGEVELHFDCAVDAFLPLLMQHGSMPLPPYIRQGKAGAADATLYQTIYARHEGAVAAPTAGLHFTERLFNEIDARGATRVEVTLHVGAGTFLPVKAEDTLEHKMHAEFGVLSADVAAQINTARKKGGCIIAVGTTSLRLLESAADEHGVLHPFSGDTDIFITPGYDFKAVDMLLTNFHLPKSTLFMLVSAFSGLEAMKAAYAHAIEKEYRFYSYGDACLLFSK